MTKPEPITEADLSRLSTARTNVAMSLLTGGGMETVENLARLVADLDLMAGVYRAHLDHVREGKATLAGAK